MFKRSIPLSGVVRQSPVAFVASLSCILSFWLTLRFFGQLCPHESRFELWAMGGLWESAKIVFSTAGLREYASPHTRPRGVLLLGLALVLAAGSVVASLGFVSAADTQGRQQVLVASAQYQRAKSKVGGLENQLALLVKTANDDMAQGFRTRGLKVIEKIDSLTGQRDAAAAEMAAMEAAGGAQGDAKSAIPESIRVTGHCVLAVMLELIGIASMALLGGKAKMASSSLFSVPAREPPPSPPRPTRPPLRAVTMAAPSQAPVDAKGKYMDARQGVLDCQIRPCYRALQEAFFISQSTAQRYLRRMRAEGIVERVGRTYALAQDVMIGGAA